MQYCLVLLSFFLIFGLSAQENRPSGLGQWRAHPAITDIVAVESSPEFVYFASSSAVFIVIKDSRWIASLQRVNGLSDAGIRDLVYQPDYRILVIAYENGNIDVYDEETRTVRNFPGILDNRSIFGDKRINQLYCQGSDIYIACNFGLVVLDYPRGVFRQTTFTGSTQVLGSARLADTLFMSTTQGVYSIPLQTGFNPLDFGAWTLHGQAQGLSLNAYESGPIRAWRDAIYTSINDTLMRYQAGHWQHISHVDSSDGLGQTRPFLHLEDGLLRLEISETGDRLLLCSEQNYFAELKSNQVFNRRIFFNLSLLRDVVYDAGDYYWFANPEGAWVGRGDYWELMRIDGPRSPMISAMQVDRQGRLWCTGGPRDNIRSYFSRNGFYRFDGAFWTNFNSSNTPLLEEMYDFVAVAANASKDEVFLGSFLTGLARLGGQDTLTLFTGTCQGGEFVLANPSAPARTRITGLAYDKDNQLWITNMAQPANLLMMDKQNRCHEFTAVNNAEVVSVAIDRNGYKWLGTFRNGLIVFDEGKLDEPSDDRVVALRTDNADLGSNRITSIQADRNGSIWVGTNNGLTIFSCGSNVFDGGCTGNRPVINPDNFNGRLLENENVQAIVVDGANRKWVGTSSGLFLFSPDGLELLEYFTKENSPLPDNSVQALAIDSKEGYVYVSTTQGLVSYRGEATRGRTFNDKSQVKVFPNPVKPDYTGPIAISGLVEDVLVKITDVSGRLIHEGRSLGGQFLWNGLDYNGRRAASGVYLVFTVSSDAAQRLATKIVLVN